MFPAVHNRQESVRIGVSHIAPDPDVIMVHDAVRPVCDRDLIMRVLDAAWKKGAAIPGLPATETIQRVSRTGRVLSTPPREELYGIQTPQAFHAGILRSALEKAHETGFLGTDESSVVRWAGHPVVVVPGSPDNIKITRPLDLQIAELLISRKGREGLKGMNQSKLRIGQGIDYHRLVEGRKLILGGVDIPFEKGLEGHSDADALSHAICDALLGAAALGDIGQHFPDTDPANRGRSSLEFLRLVREKIEAAGWQIRNVDATLLVQRPKTGSLCPGDEEEYCGIPWAELNRSQHQGDDDGRTECRRPWRGNFRPGHCAFICIGTRINTDYHRFESVIIREIRGVF